MNRRSFFKALGVGSAATALPTLSACHPEAMPVGFSLKLAGYGYDRVRAIIDGRLTIEDIALEFHVRNIYETTQAAFGPERTYQVTEIGLIPFIRKYVNEGFRDYNLVPIFISRMFRHRNVFVHVDSGIETPEDLRGKRVGTPGYAFSANTWIRGFLQDEYGVAANEMHWIETTESSDGATLSPKLDRHFLQEDFPLVKGPPGVDESELLLSGGCDALITAITPRAFLEDDPRIVRLFPNVRETEQAYFRKTGVFPIMHAVAIRSDVGTSRPSLVEEVFELYSKAKAAAYADLETTTALQVSLPWVTQELEATREVMGKNFWRYGLEANRKELELAMRYSYEQGLIKERVPIDELFLPSTLELTERSLP